MRKWTMSACVVLAWCTLPLTAAAGFRVTGPTQAITSTAITSSTATTSSSTAAASAATTSAAAASAANSTTRLVLASYPAASKPDHVTRATTLDGAAPARPPATWTVRPGDTLSAIAAALGIPGGWPALYAANRPAIGPDPGLIRAGTVLALPGPVAPARYAVAPGDTLSAIAAALAVKGGWPALYAANRRAIGPDPALIRPGTVLTAPRPGRVTRAAAPHQATPGIPPAAATHRTAPPAPPGGRQAPPRPVYQAAPGQAPPGHLAAPGRLTVSAPAGGMPRWLVDLLLAAGVLAATAFAAEPAAAIARRRKAAGPGPTTRPDKNTRPDRNARPGTITRLDRNARRGTTDRPAWVSWLVPAQRSGKHRVSGTRDLAKRAAEKAKIILADHERLIVTYSIRDHTVYVLTPPGEDPRTVLAAARLVVPEDTYQDLAGHLGVPSAWPLE